VAAAESPNPFQWLLTEGALPLFGAGVLYIFLRTAMFLSVPADKKKDFKFSLREALDPMGWLYGAGILSVQLGMKSLANGSQKTLIGAIFDEGLACLLLLLAAMTNRAESDTWRPPRRLQVAAGLLVVLILFEGAVVYNR
jgi:hypothetical protein